MKWQLYSIFIFYFLLFLFSSCGKQNTVSIKGEIDNLESPYILASYVSADTLAIDTIQLNNKGRFSYTKSIDTLTVFTLYFNDYSTSAVVFADKNQKLKLEGDAKIPDLIRITGNEINEDLTLFKEENEELLKQRAQMFLAIDSNKIATESVLFENEETTQLNTLNHELKQIAEEYIKSNPTKTASLILINDFFVDAENPEALSRVLGYLKGDIANASLANNLKAYSEKINRSAEGAQMPYFQLTDKDGKKIQSSSLLGKYVVLSFLSSAGVDSRENVKMLKESYKSLNKDSVAFISVYIDTDIYPVSYLKNDSIPWAAVPEKKSWSSDIVDAYNIQFIPVNVLINPDGVIADRNVSAQQIVSILKKTPSGALM